jgi:pimeloyl-ACP methyl ester carboxylesterase
LPFNPSKASLSMHSNNLLRVAAVLAMSIVGGAIGCGSDSSTGASTASSTGDSTSSSTGGATSSSTGGDPKPTPYVIVHGAWQGAWAWDSVAAGLKAKGASVTVVELPAHGDDTTALSAATFDAYTAKVESAVDAAGGPVVLVGHSMGGMVISEVAEHRADKIDKLIYVAGFVPKNGDSTLALAQTDADSHLGSALIVDMAAGTANLPMDKLDDVFCADCSMPALQSLHAHYRVEPLAPLVATVHLTAGSFGKVAKYYVYAKQDHAISYPFQQKMTTGVTFAATASLDTGHSPFLSNPDLMITTLLGF